MEDPRQMLQQAKELGAREQALATDVENRRRRLELVRHRTGGGQPAQGPAPEPPLPPPPQAAIDWVNRNPWFMEPQHEAARQRVQEISRRLRDQQIPDTDPRHYDMIDRELAGGPDQGSPPAGAAPQAPPKARGRGYSPPPVNSGEGQGRTGPQGGNMNAENGWEEHLLDDRLLTPRELAYAKQFVKVPGTVTRLHSGGIRLTGLDQAYGDQSVARVTSGSAPAETTAVRNQVGRIRR